MKVTRARVLAAVAGWLVLLSPLLLAPKGRSGMFIGAVVLTGASALLALGAWRFARFVLERVRSGRRRTQKTLGKIGSRHVEIVYESGGKLARWTTTVRFPTGTGGTEKGGEGRVEWVPYGAYTNMESVINRVERRNPLGKEVSVYFDPRDPSNATVGARMSLLLYPVFALGALVLALALITFVTVSLFWLLTSFAVLMGWLP